VKVPYVQLVGNASQVAGHLTLVTMLMMRLSASAYMAPCIHVD